jgi:hypothetical protein
MQMADCGWQMLIDQPAIRFSFSASIEFTPARS